MRAALFFYLRAWQGMMDGLVLFFLPAAKGKKTFPWNWVLGKSPPPSRACVRGGPEAPGQLQEWAFITHIG